MMLTILVLGVTAVLTINADIYPDCPSCLKVENTCYKITHLLDLDKTQFRKQIVIPKMAILRSKNILFYSFEPVFEDREYYKTGFINLEDPALNGTISARQVDQVLNLGTFDIDQDNNLIYLGGSNGIYALDLNTSEMYSYSSRGDIITKIFYKNKVYFTKYNEKGITVKKGTFFESLCDEVMVHNFIITKDNIIVYLSNTGLYVSKGDDKHRLSIYPFFRGLTMDLDGKVYTWWLDGIYKIDVNKNLTESTMSRIAELEDIGTITFDNNNNILFNVGSSLYLMLETTTGCGSQ